MEFEFPRQIRFLYKARNQVVQQTNGQMERKYQPFLVNFARKPRQSPGHHLKMKFHSEPVRCFQLRKRAGLKCRQCGCLKCFLGRKCGFLREWLHSKLVGGHLCPSLVFKGSHETGRYLGQLQLLFNRVLRGYFIIQSVCFKVILRD